MIAHPGPWKHDAGVVTDANGEEVLFFGGYGFSDEHARRLVLSAPDLLAMLKTVQVEIQALGRMMLELGRSGGDLRNRAEYSLERMAAEHDRACELNKSIAALLKSSQEVTCPHCGKAVE